jgi:hypothetical protein
MFKLKINYFYLMLLLSLVACGDFQKPIEVPLPEHTSRLVAECYLEEGQGYRLLLTESTSYFAGVTLPNVPNATVLMTYKGKTDTLAYKPANLDTLQKFYNYQAKNSIVLDTVNDYTLFIKDNKGRIAESKTKFKAAINIDSIAWNFSKKDDKAYLIVRFKDNPKQNNYYRLTVHKSKLTTKPLTDFTFSDNFFSGTGAILTGYSFEEKDTLFVSLYHIDKEFFEFLDTSRDASRANGNPFAFPSGVISNIKGGGTGILTALSFTRKRVIIKK